MKIIDLSNKKIYSDIQSSYFEFEGAKNIIIYMINNNMINSKEYQYYWNEYIKYLIKYENIKQQLETEIILPETNNEGGKWRVDFMKEVVIIE